jgi:hypothetical protein
MATDLAFVMAFVGEFEVLCLSTRTRRNQNVVVVFSHYIWVIEYRGWV